MERAAEPEPSWETRRDQALVDIETLMHNVTETRQHLQAYLAVLEENHRHLSSGGRVDETPTLFDIRAVRTMLTERLELLERARNTARLALWRLQAAEGATFAEIARMWGFSRQLVSRALADGERRRSTTKR